jgi:hypothetical protein
MTTVELEKRSSFKFNYCQENYVEHGWATLFDSRATLETKLVDVGLYKYDKDQFDMTFEKNGLLAVHFLKKSILKGIFNVLSS